MIVTVNIGYLLMAAFGVLGMIQWVKSLIRAIQKAKKEKKIDTLAWVLMSFAFSFVVAAAGDGGIFQIATNGIFILAINEIVGYNIIIKSVFALIENLVGKVGLSNEALLGAQKRFKNYVEGGKS